MTKGYGSKSVYFSFLSHIFNVYKFASAPFIMVWFSLKSFEILTLIDRVCDHNIEIWGLKILNLNFCFIPFGHIEIEKT